MLKFKTIFPEKSNPDRFIGLKETILKENA